MAKNDVETHHPDYDDKADEWALMRVTARGATAVKNAGTEYLPMPLGFKQQRDKGRAMYGNYKSRAQVPEFVTPTIAGMSGIICKVEIKVEDLPTEMEPIWEKATKDGLPLEALYRRLVEEILTTGRYALLAEAADAAAGGSDIPWIAGYSAETLINWSTDRTFYVLDECGLVRDGFKWVDSKKYRVLELSEGGQYQQVVYEGDNLAAAAPLTPTSRGASPLTEIPFVVIGPRDLSVGPDMPPLIGVANSTISSYQLSADYRHQLYMSGQETLFVFGGDAPTSIGAGVVVSIKGVSKDEHPPSAEYVGPSCTGIEAHKAAIDDEREAAAQAGAKLFDTDSSVQESGEAKKIRYAAQTATLTSIAQTTASGLEKVLRYIAGMMKLAGADKITVIPNLEFLATEMTPVEAQALVSMWQNHAISYETLYENLQSGGIASDERTFEDELDLIDSEMTDDPAITGSLRTGDVLPGPSGPSGASGPSGPTGPAKPKAKTAPKPKVKAAA